jgi:hypothetical protein
VGDPDIDEVDVGTEDNPQVRAASVFPKVLTRLHKALTAGTLDPVSQDINARVMASKGSVSQALA